MNKKGLSLFLYTVVYACGNNQGHDVYVALNAVIALGGLISRPILDLGF
jgi:hypothetical protein